MGKLSLRKRRIEDEADAYMRTLLEEFGALEPDAQETAIKMLAHSKPFVDFIEFVSEKNGDSRHQTRLVDVGERFQQKFAQNIASSRSMSWTEALNNDQPDILQRTIGKNVPVTDPSVSGGWHSVLTPKNDTDGFMLVGAKTTQRGSVQHQEQMRVVAELFPEYAYKYENIRHPSNPLETRLGLRSGRIHFFLAEDALQNVSGIALHKSYLDAEPNELIVFTMHARFFFVCSAKDLSDWLKTHQARLTFGENMLRMQGHKYPATQNDIQRFNPMESFSVEEFLQTKGGHIDKIPLDRRANAYLSSMDRTLPSLAPHLTWNTPVVAEQLGVQKKIQDLLTE